EVYVLEHASLSTQEIFRASGTGIGSILTSGTFTIQGSVVSESYQSSGVEYSESARFVLYPSSLTTTGNAFPRPYNSCRPTANTTATWRRAYAGTGGASWAQVVDFGGITSPDVTLTPTPAVVTLAAPAPVLLVKIDYHPTPAVLALGAPAPLLLVKIDYHPTPARVTLGAPAPGLFVELDFHPTPALLSLTAPPPVLLVEIDYHPTPAVVSLGAPAPGLFVELDFHPTPGRVTLGAPPPLLEVEIEVHPTPAVLSLTAPPPLLLVE